MTQTPLTRSQATEAQPEAQHDHEQSGQATHEVAPFAASALAGFSRFSRGITATPPEEREAVHSVGSQEHTIALPTVAGALPGEVAGVEFWIPLRQLRLAPAEDLLCSLYQPTDDPDFEQYTRALDQLGDQIPALPVLPANRALVQGGQEDPIYLVYDQPEVYYGLIALKKKLARVYLASVTSPGAILLSAMGRHGQLRREPSLLEVCLASKRLKDTYGYTLQEIAQMQARNAEENGPPSVTQVHYQIVVGGFPPVVQQLFHRRHIGWSHAKLIADYCAEDETRCTQLALLVAQNGRMSVVALGQTINRLKDGLTELQTNEEGQVVEVATGRGKPSAGGGEKAPGIPPRSLVFYQGLMAAAPAQVQGAARTFSVQVEQTANEQIAVSPGSMNDLCDRLNALNNPRAPTPIQEIEAMVRGYMEAVRAAAAQHGYLNKEGALAKIVEGRAHTGGAPRTKTG